MYLLLLKERKIYKQAIRNKKRTFSRAPFVNPFFSSSNSCPKMQELDDFCRVLSDQWGTLDISTLSPRVPMVEDVECSEKHTRATVQIIVDNTEIKARKEE